MGKASLKSTWQSTTEHVYRFHFSPTPSTRVARESRNVETAWFGAPLRGQAQEQSANPSPPFADKKCPFTGLVSIRGRILTGTVVSTKMHRTIIIRREYLHYIPKYSRYEKRHTNLAAHCSPAFRVVEGDQVTVGQCRPLSKTVRFNVLRVLPRTGKAVKAFSKF